MKATEIVQARLFPKLRRSGDKRKTKSKAAHGKQFGSYYQIGYHRFFNDTPAILERVAIEKYVPCNCPSLGNNKKVPAELDPCPLAGKIRSS